MKKKKISFDDELPITSHLEEFRWRLIIVLIVLAVFFVIAFTFSEKLLLIFKKPIKDYELVFLTPSEVFFSHLKMSFFVALFFSTPVILYQIWSFVSPGLLTKEKKYTAPFVISASLFFIIGLLFGHYAILPLGLTFLMTYKTTGVRPCLSISQYLSFYTNSMLVFGIIFELPVVIVFLTKLGLVKPAFLTKNRKYAILIIFIVAAIFTPPDEVSQILMAIPLLILYEISIVGSKLVYREKQKTKEEKNLA